MCADMVLASFLDLYQLRTESTYGLVDKKNKATTSEYSEQCEDNQQLSQDLEELLHTLSPRERAVLRMRCAFNCGCILFVSLLCLNPVLKVLVEWELWQVLP